MAATTKILLLSKTDASTYGTGLNVIRELEDNLEDLADDFPDHLDDSTSSSNWQRIIKNNVVYRIIKTYFDLDNNWRIVMALEDMNPQDVSDS